MKPDQPVEAHDISGSKIDFDRCYTSIEKMNDRKDEPIGKYRTRGRGIVIVGCDKDKTNNVGMLSAASLYLRLLAKLFQSGSQRDTSLENNSRVFILADSFTKITLRCLLQAIMRSSNFCQSWVISSFLAAMLRNSLGRLSKCARLFGFPTLLYL
jgi:hypothetical protein